MSKDVWEYMSPRKRRRTFLQTAKVIDPKKGISNFTGDEILSKQENNDGPQPIYRWVKKKLQNGTEKFYR